ncbi:MAG: response regulator [Planctomycetota bacterium]
MIAQNEQTAPTIMLVDDDDVDLRLAKRSLGRLLPGAHVLVRKDGIDALEGLRTDIRTSRCIIVLDLNMPRMNGLEMLRELRKDPALRSHVVFVYSTSTHSDDIQICYELNVAGYLVKTDSADQLGELLATYIERVRLGL